MLINHKISYISEIDKFFLASPENEIYFCASFLEATLSDFSDKYGDDFLSSPIFLIYPHLSFTLSDNDKIVSNGINTTIGVKSSVYKYLLN